MTQDEIIEMARQAGFTHPNPHDGYMGLAYDRRETNETGASLETFAKLIAAKAVEREREACAKVCETALYQLQETMNELSSSEYMEQCVVQGAMNQAVKLTKAIRSRNSND